MEAPDLTRATFRLLALGVLIATSFWILRPFLVALAWATTIVVATWPLSLRAEACLGGRRSAVVTVQTLALLLIVVVPLYLSITTIVEHAGQFAEWSTSQATVQLAEPPTWIASLPLIGPKLAARWEQLATAGSGELATALAPYGQRIVRWFVELAGGAGTLFLQLLLTVIVAAILCANGETAARAVNRFARRLAGAEGEQAVQLAALAIRGVALGVVVTAIVQSALTGLGLLVVGVPFAGVLTAVIFIFSIAQIGPVLVLIPTVIWVYSTQGPVWGSAFLVWAIFCTILDNVLRPVLIKRGADLPLLLVFAGVVGGLIAFGVIGLFIGPVALAVAYTLLVHWVSAGDTPEADAAPPKAFDTTALP